MVQHPVVLKTETAPASVEIQLILHVPFANWGLALLWGTQVGLWALHHLPHVHGEKVQTVPIILAGTVAAGGLELPTVSGL